MTTTPQYGKEISDLMKTAMTGESFQLILAQLRIARDKAEKKLK